jgi:hypothetical protein
MERGSGPVFVSLLQLIRRTKKGRLKTLNFTPIDTSTIASRLSAEKRSREEYRAVLHKNAVRFLELYYEDLYAPTLSTAQKVDRLNDIFEFLGRRRLAAESQQVNLKKLFSTNQKIATPDVYRAIPGIEAVEEKFGSDETGWLFK